MGKLNGRTFTMHMQRRQYLEHVDDLLHSANRQLSVDGSGASCINTGFLTRQKNRSTKAQSFKKYIQFERKRQKAIPTPNINKTVVFVAEIRYSTVVARDGDNPNLAGTDTI